MEHSENSNLISMMKDRKSQYEFLCTAFSNPILKEVLNIWKEQLSFKSIISDEHFRLFFSELSSQKVEEIFEKEKENFLRLFFGPEHIPAPPWESVYRTRERLLFGEPTLKMREKLKIFNLNYEEENKEPEDHISLELEFMSHLIDKSLKSINEENEKEFSRALHYQFLLLDDHLVKWAEPFTEDILSFTTSAFYKGLAQFLREFIKQDYQYMSGIKEVLGNE
ncbi:TorD/DmsD family molecular chaperone [Cytobacillus dafuensis]|uniref:Molecular chaperone TorD family protein n=1 Tax=Cytobacillus dafuensis TaxID=1742359 RepID=A0A5B8ZB03_CYTDA|nr:molecular chaperone TorD family protein [Cytobacillus dafuensis]QED49463.1 hypothetical protein FSZ17_20555 [Cytobacillus dafuensis]